LGSLTGDLKRGVLSDPQTSIKQELKKRETHERGQSKKGPEIFGESGIGKTGQLPANNNRRLQKKG